MLAAFVPILDTLFVIDNSGVEPVLIARKAAGKVEISAAGRLPLVENVLGF